MHAVIQVAIVGAILFFLANPKRSEPLLEKIAPSFRSSYRSDPSIDELYNQLFEMIPKRHHEELEKAKKYTIQFKQEVLKKEGQIDYVKLLNLKSKIMTYLHQCTFFLPNDLNNELQIRAYIQKISLMLQGYLYQLFGTPFDDFGYTSMQDVVY